MTYVTGTLICDSEKNVFSIRETSRYTNIPYSTVYSYVTISKCNTIRKIIDERERRKGLTGWANTVKPPTHKTKFGYLTAREIWEKHSYKDTVSLSMISNRLNSYGGMATTLWLGRQHV
jgi:hypothetical protein